MALAEARRQTGLEVRDARLESSRGPMHRGLQPRVPRLQPGAPRLQPLRAQVHDALLLVKDGYDAKCEERRRRKQQAEEAACTFKPATNERVNERARVVARVTQPAPPPKEDRQTTLEKEVADHCTFKPATNDYRGGASVSRTDSAFSPTTLAGLRAVGNHKRELGYSHASSEAVLGASSRRSSRAPSARGEMSPYVPPVPPVPPMQSGLQSLESPAAQALLARSESQKGLAAESESESALLAEIGVDAAPPTFRPAEEGAPSKPLSAQQLEAQFYADLAAELRDVDF